MLPKSSRSRSDRLHTADHRVGLRRNVEWRVGRIISIIASGRHPNCQSLAKEIDGVSAKSIQRDINYLRNDKGLPLEYNDKKHGWYFTEPVSEFAPMQLSLGEVLALFVAEKAVEPLQGTKIHRLVRECVHKIASACPEAADVKWHEMEAAFSMKASSSLKSDVTVFTKLVNAVMHRQELAFLYHKLRGRTKELRRVQPYHVGQFENGWYLVAWDHDRQDWRTFALQRMSGVEMLKKKFQRDPKFDPKAHNGTGFGVWSYSADVEPFEVRIRFTGWAARVVEERHWHATQQISTLARDGSEIEFRARLSGIEEITRWVLSWGSNAKVFGPPELRKRVKDELKKMTAMNA